MVAHDYGGAALSYSAMDSVGEDAYYKAWPFVQASGG